MPTPSETTQIVSLVQVGFAGWVAVYCLTKLLPAITEVNKSLATLMEINAEIRAGVKDMIMRDHSARVGDRGDRNDA